MSTSQRVSRGFHRLALFLAAIPLLVGGFWSVVTSLNEASSASTRHQQVLCAHKLIVVLNGNKEARPGDPKPSGPKIEIEGLGTIPVGEDFLSLSQDKKNNVVEDILEAVKAQKAGLLQWWAAESE